MIRDEIPPIIVARLPPSALTWYGKSSPIDINGNGAQPKEKPIIYYDYASDSNILYAIGTFRGVQ